ncbi:TPA: hypothetical protein ACWCA2_003287 [Escherichia coli]
MLRNRARRLDNKIMR